MRARLEEFEPRRRRVEQIAHLDAGAGRMGRRHGPALGAALDGERPGRVCAAPPRRDREPADRADRGQRLAAEPEGADLQRDRRSGSFEVQWRSTASASSSARHADAVVGHRDAGSARRRAA